MDNIIYIVLFLYIILYIIFKNLYTKKFTFYMHLSILLLLIENKNVLFFNDNKLILIS